MCGRWTCRDTQQVQRTPLRPASVDVQRVWETYDDRLQFMTGSVALLLDESCRTNDVSRAWLVRSGAVEATLAVPARGLVIGRGAALFSVVILGVADAHDASDVFMYRGSSSFAGYEA